MESHTSHSYRDEKMEKGLKIAYQHIYRKPVNHTGEAKKEVKIITNVYLIVLSISLKILSLLLSLSDITFLNRRIITAFGKDRMFSCHVTNFLRIFLYKNLEQLWICILVHKSIGVERNICPGNVMLAIRLLNKEKK